LNAFKRGTKQTAWTTAQLKLVDFLKNKRTNGSKGDRPVVFFRDAVELFKTRVQHDSSMKESSKGYRLLCIRKIKSSWPDLWNVELSG
jgi:hypothetical protein